MRSLVFTLILFGGTAHAAVEVSLESCEAYLLVGGAAAHGEGVRGWLRQSAALPVFIDKEERIDADLNLIEMFDQEQMHADNTVEIAEAAEEMKKGFIAALTSMGPALITGESHQAHRAFSSEDEIFGRTPLSKMDKIAFGFRDPEKEVRVNEVKDVTMSVEGSELRFRSELLDLRIPLEPTHIGFYYRFPSYNTGPHHPKTIQDFMRQHGVALFERRVGDIRFGYAIPLETVTWGLPIADLEVRIYLIRDCEMRVNTPKQAIFPRADGESGSLNLCLTDTGLSLNHFRDGL